MVTLNYTQALCIEAIDSVTVSNSKSHQYQVIIHNQENKKISDSAGVTSFDLHKGQKAYIMGTNTTPITTSETTSSYFIVTPSDGTMDTAINVSGYLDSLCGRSSATTFVTQSNKIFRRIFAGVNVFDASQLKINPLCTYYELFSGCKNLCLGPNSYGFLTSDHTYLNTKNLQSFPDKVMILKSHTANPLSYNGNVEGCSQLVAVPKISVAGSLTTVQNLFKGCWSLRGLNILGTGLINSNTSNFPKYSFSNLNVMCNDATPTSVQRVTNFADSANILGDKTCMYFENGIMYSGKQKYSMHEMSQYNTYAQMNGNKFAFRKNSNDYVSEIIEY